MIHHNSTHNEPGNTDKHKHTITAISESHLANSEMSLSLYVRKHLLSTNHTNLLLCGVTADMRVYNTLQDSVLRTGMSLSQVYHDVYIT